MQIEIIETGAVLSEADFYDMHPTVGFPQPLNDDVLADFGARIVVQPPPDPPSQFERDKSRYEKRAAAKDSLIAYMAADNMSRVRLGVDSGGWTVADLTSLMSDPALAAANAYMGTLSFELAAQAIASATTPLLTPAIRADWIAKLTEHFYLEG